MTERAYADGGTFHWRVAAADDDITNVGDFSAARPFVLPADVLVPPRAATRVSAVVRVGRRSTSVTGQPRYAAAACGVSHGDGSFSHSSSRSRSSTRAATASTS